MKNNTVSKWFLYSSINLNIKVNTQITMDLSVEDRITENRKKQIEKFYLFPAGYARMLNFIYTIS